MTWILFWGKTQNNLFSSAGHRFWACSEKPLDWIPQLANAAQKKISENWASNPITQDAVFQCLSDTPLSKSSTLCVKSIPSVWRICAPVGIVVQTHAGVYDALGCQKCFLPLSYLLNQSPPHVLLFQFVCAPKHLSHTFSLGTALWLQQWNSNAQKVSSCLLKIANFLLDTFLQAYTAAVQKKFSSITYFCCGSLQVCIISAIQMWTAPLDDFELVAVFQVWGTVYQLLEEYLLKGKIALWHHWAH